MTYRLNELVFAYMPRLTETSVRAALREAFATWAAVGCQGKRPFLVEQATTLTSTSFAEMLLDAPNESIIVARSERDWAALADHDPNALALTLLWFDKRNGEILDVDMELNAGVGSFADCATTACSSGMVDLQNTVTHEAGHLLGLGHSLMANSTMDQRTYSESEVSKRALSDDDRAGYCALDLPEPDCAGSHCTCPAPRPAHSRKIEPLRGSCQIRSGPYEPAPHWLESATIAALGMCLRRERRRKRQAQETYLRHYA